MSRYAYLLLLPLPFLSFGCDGLSSSSRDDDEDEDEEDDDDDDDEGSSVSSGGSAESNVANLVSLYEDCQTRYDDWENEIEDADDSDDVESILDQVAELERDLQVRSGQFQTGFSLAVENLDEDGREDAFDEYTDEVESPTAECASARVDFSREMADNSVACDAYFEWYSGQDEDWQDWDEAASSYAMEGDSGGWSRVPPTIRAYQIVPRPYQVYNSEMCGGGDAEGVAEEDVPAGGGSAGPSGPSGPPPSGASSGPPSTPGVRNLGYATGNYVASGTNYGEVDTYNGCGATGGRDVIMQWTAPYSGTYTFDTSSSSYDTVLRIRSSTSTYGSDVACNDDGGPGMTSELSQYVSGGQTVYIVVDAFSSSHTGSWVLDINR